MKITVDSLNAEDFERLQKYVSNDSNRYTDGSTSMGYKVLVESVGKTKTTPITTTEALKKYNINVEHVCVCVADGRLTQRELEELMDILYKEHPDILHKPYWDLELPARACNALEGLEIETVKDVTKLTEADILAQKRVGTTTLRQIKRKLSDHGLCLKNDTD